MSKQKPLLGLKKVLPWLLIVGSIIGIAASLILTYDQIQVWKDPSYQPACSINPIVSCGTVIDSKQGEIFGIPAPFFGLLAFPALATIGVALLAGAKFARWFWRLIWLGTLGGVIFALWLFWLSLYKVHALCPFCLTVDVAVYTLFWYVSLYVLREKHFTLSKKFGGALEFASKHHLDILILWFVFVIIFILHHFWYYFGQHL